MPGDQAAGASALSASWNIAKGIEAIPRDVHGNRQCTDQRSLRGVSSKKRVGFVFNGPKTQMQLYRLIRSYDTMVVPMVFEESSMINLSLTTLFKHFLLLSAREGSQLDCPVKYEMGALVVLATLLASQVVAEEGNMRVSKQLWL